MNVINIIVEAVLARKYTGIKAYKTIARPILVYGYEASKIREADE